MVYFLTHGGTKRGENWSGGMTLEDVVDIGSLSKTRVKFYKKV